MLHIYIYIYIYDISRLKVKTLEISVTWSQAAVFMLCPPVLSLPLLDASRRHELNFWDEVRRCVQEMKPLMGPLSVPRMTDEWKCIIVGTHGGATPN